MWLKNKYLGPIVESYVSESIDKELLQNTCNCDSNEPVLLDGLTIEIKVF